VLNERGCVGASIIAVLVFSALLKAAPAESACRCQRASTCDEVAASNLVFIGTVVSIQPKFLGKWNEASQPSLVALNAAYLQARDHPSADALARLKEAYLKAFPDASPDRKKQVQKAGTAGNVAAFFYSSVDRGAHVRFRVQKLFKHQDDDEDDRDNAKQRGEDKDADKKRQPQPEPGFLDVWTPFGECGVAFQVGETYLVYANDDEETPDSIATDACSRTRRLSDAGEDLSYLYFYKEHPEASTRIDGYATTNARYLADFDAAHPETLRQTAPNAIVALQSGGLTRVAEADEKGHFVFDGLAEGDYQLRAYTSAYPLLVQTLAEPPPFHLAAKSCSLKILVLSADPAKDAPR